MYIYAHTYKWFAERGGIGPGGSDFLVSAQSQIWRVKELSEAASPVFLCFFVGEPRISFLGPQTPYPNVARAIQNNCIRCVYSFLVPVPPRISKICRGTPSKKKSWYTLYRLKNTPLIDHSVMRELANRRFPDNLSKS